jgi:hypothetical protein
MRISIDKSLKEFIFLHSMPFISFLNSFKCFNRSLYFCLERKLKMFSKIVLKTFEKFNIN